MSKLRVGIVIAVVSALGAFGAGCGGDEPAAPAASTAASTPSTPTPSTPTPPAGGTGDVATGKTLFEGTCQGCHAKGGTEAGAGPVLAGGGRTAERIRDQVVNGGANMPAGLASGADLDNVVAFVLSIQ